MTGPLELKIYSSGALEVGDDHNWIFSRLECPELIIDVIDSCALIDPVFEDIDLAGEHSFVVLLDLFGDLGLNDY